MLQLCAKTADRAKVEQQVKGGEGGEAAEFAGMYGGMKHEKKKKEEGVAGLTIFKPDLAFLKARIRHQVPSFQRRKQSFLPD